MLVPVQLHFGDLLYIQVCSDATPKHCSTGQCKIASLLLSAALQNMLTACFCHCSYAYVGPLLASMVGNAWTPTLSA